MYIAHLVTASIILQMPDPVVAFTSPFINFQSNKQRNLWALCYSELFGVKKKLFSQIQSSSQKETDVEHPETKD